VTGELLRAEDFVSSLDPADGIRWSWLLLGCHCNGSDALVSGLALSAGMAQFEHTCLGCTRHVYTYTLMLHSLSSLPGSLQCIGGQR
jgi:hypothetical protein